MKTINPLKSATFYSFCILSGFVLLATHLSAAENWPEFRGPGGQGHSQAKDVPVEWGPNKNIAWKTSIPGIGWSSSIIVDSKIYLTTAIPKGKNNYSLHALCVNADDGKILWNVKVFDEQADEPARMHKKNSHASPTPDF